MWTQITRPKYDRRSLRYASDLMEGEWALIEPYLPPIKAVGRPRTTDLREVVNPSRAGCWSGRSYFGDIPFIRRYFGLL